MDAPDITHARGFHPGSRNPNRRRGQALAWQGDAATPEAVSAALQTNDNEPRIYTPPGTAATTSVNQKNTQINAWKRKSTHEHKPHTRVRQMKTTRARPKPPAVKNSRTAWCHRDTQVLVLPRDDTSLDFQLHVASPEPHWTSSLGGSSDSVHATSESYQTVSGGEPEDTRDHGDGGDTGLSVNTGVSGEGKGDAGVAISLSEQGACNMQPRDDQQMHNQRPNALGARATKPAVR